MLFTSFSFFALLTLTWALYYATRKKAVQVAVATLASFVFYAWNFPFLLSLLLASIAINIGVSYRVAASSSPAARRAYAVLGVLANLGILGFFKYSPLIGRTFFGADSSVGDFLVAIPLPIGISFFTFQGISLVVDTFTGKDPSAAQAKEQNTGLKHYAANIALFIAFFPQLIAGPIVKAHEFLPQIRAKHLRDIQWEICFRNLVIGYFLKMFVADNLKDQTFWIQYPYFESSSVVELVTLLYGYAIQIFADFAGYSLIAIGVAGLFGYQLRDNFLFPYISTSFSEFWRRWHISLSTFLREYLYIPLGGNRRGNVRTYANLMTTMVLGGLWHGAAWSYAVWGFYHGVALAIERLAWDTFRSPFRVPPFLQGAGVFVVVAVGFLLFKLPSFDHFIRYMQCMFTNPLWLADTGTLLRIFFTLVYSIPVIVYHAAYAYQEHYSLSFAGLRRLDPIYYGLMLFFILANSGSSIDFIYFQF